MITCKALAGLLLYPDQALMEALPDIRYILNDSPLPVTQRDQVIAFCDHLAATDPIQAQGNYVSLFDGGSRALSLYLFGHVHGDSRDRGQAMANLVEDYRAVGLELSGDELPDFLPVFLEYVSCHAPSDAAVLLGEIVEIVALLASRLEKRGTPYAAVLRAIEALGSRPADTEVVASRLAEGEQEDTPEALDARYEEAPVSFMEPAVADSACSNAAALVAQFERDVQVSPIRLIER